jgi:hypothetical protein
LTPISCSNWRSSVRLGRSSRTCEVMVWRLIEGAGS